METQSTSVLRKSPTKAQTAAVPIRLLTYYYRKVQRGNMLPLEPRLCIHLGGIFSIYWSPSVPGPPSRWRAPVTMFIYRRRSRLANLALFPKRAVWRDLPSAVRKSAATRLHVVLQLCAEIQTEICFSHTEEHATDLPASLLFLTFFVFSIPQMNELSVNIRVCSPHLMTHTHTHTCQVRFTVSCSAVAAHVACFDMCAA